MTTPFKVVSKGVKIDPEKEPRPRSDEGSVYKKVVRRKGANGKMRDVTIWFARQRYTDKNGKERELKRTCPSQSAALTKLRELQDEVKELLDPKPKTVEIEQMSFSDFALEWEAENVKEAVIIKGKKVEGYKEKLSNIRHQLKMMREFFADKILHEIEYEDIKKYKISRLQTPVKKIVNVKVAIDDEYRKNHGLNVRQKFIYKKKEEVKEREVASVNRELSRMRTILKHAVRKRRIAVSPFDQGEPIIKKSHEVVRDRIASNEEERLLIAQCVGKRVHLKNIIVFAIHTAMRQGEIFKLEWTDIDIKQRTIRVREETTKTEKVRIVPMSSTVAEILKELKTINSKTTVFGIKSCDTAWENARTDAGIEDLHFHDLRATGITRMLRAGIQQAEVMKISGHTEISTFMKYVRQDDEGMMRLAKMMDLFFQENDALAPCLPLRESIESNSDQSENKSGNGKDQ